MADYQETPEVLPPLARGLRTWVSQYQLSERILKGEELVKFWRLEFHPELAFQLDENTRRAYETIAAYRLTRMVAVLRGLMQPEDLLADVMDHPGEGDPWHRWWPPFGAPEFARDTLVRSAAEAVRSNPGVPLQPPMDEDGTDDGIEHWLLAMVLTSRLLCFNTHVIGRWGVERMLDTRWIYNVWPTREELVRFEAVLMDDTFTMVVDAGVAPAALALEKQYGFEPREARGIVQAARARVQRTFEVNLEEERVLLLHRLDDTYRRAKQAMDLKAERNALKDIASILGLTRAEPDDLVHEMTKTLRRINEGAELPAPTPTGLLGEPGKPVLTIPVEFQRPGKSFEAIQNMRESLDAAEAEVIRDE